MRCLYYACLLCCLYFILMNLFMIYKIHDINTLFLVEAHTRIQFAIVSTWTFNC